MIMQRVIFRSLPIFQFRTQHVIWNVSTETYFLSLTDASGHALCGTNKHVQFEDIAQSSVTVCSEVTASRCAATSARVSARADAVGTIQNRHPTTAATIVMRAKEIGSPVLAITAVVALLQLRGLRFLSLIGNLSRKD